MQKTHFLIILYRITLVSVHVAVGLIVLASIWLFCSQSVRDKLVRWWSKGLLWRFNIQVVVRGQPPRRTEKGYMVLANHISWIDIHALNSINPVRFIAKSDIDTWPVFGYLARKTGTIFINRNSRRDTARIVETTAACLSRGDNIAFFPEGTTTDGTLLARFKSSIVQAAINARSTIYPVAIRYPRPDGGINTQLAYAGETTIVEAITQTLKTKHPVVEIYFLPTISSDASNRQAITKKAYEAISRTLNL